MQIHNILKIMLGLVVLTFGGGDGDSGSEKKPETKAVTKKVLENLFDTKVTKPHIQKEINKTSMRIGKKLKDLASDTELGTALNNFIWKLFTTDIDTNLTYLSDIAQEKNGEVYFCVQYATKGEGSSVTKPCFAVYLDGKFYYAHPKDIKHVFSENNFTYSTVEESEVSGLKFVQEANDGMKLGSKTIQLLEGLISKSGFWSRGSYLGTALIAEENWARLPKEVMFSLKTDKKRSLRDYKKKLFQTKSFSKKRGPRIVQKELIDTDNIRDVFNQAQERYFVWPEENQSVPKEVPPLGMMVCLGLSPTRKMYLDKMLFDTIKADGVRLEFFLSGNEINVAMVDPKTGEHISDLEQATKKFAEFYKIDPEVVGTNWQSFFTILLDCAF